MNENQPTPETTAMSKLSAWLNRQLELMGPRPRGEVTGDSIAQAFTDVRDWLAEPGTTWTTLRERVDQETAVVIEKHRVTRPEDFAAYARSDGLRAIQSRMTEFGASS